MIWTIKFLTLITLYICGTIYVTAQATKSLEDKYRDIFERGPVTAEGPLPGCECVQFYLCNGTTMKIHGEDIIDIRAQGDCPSYLEQCCNPPGEERRDPPLPPPENKGCGYRNPDGVGFRITGDQNNEAQFGEFPWMVAILGEDFKASIGSTLSGYKCGGTLIHPQVVLTAAHCVQDASQKKYKIRAGEWDTQTTKELHPHQDRYVTSVVIHNKYYAGALFNDVALLFLDAPLNITKTVNPLCLPPQDIVIPSGTRCYASGWGKNTFGKEGMYQVILKKIDLPIVDKNTCQDQLRTTRLGKRFELHKSFVCAGGEEGKDTCKGDGGSPLACPIPGQKDRFQHVGIVAWGIGCGENQIPGVYVNIPMFRNWIDQQLTSKNLDLTYYQY